MGRDPRALPPFLTVGNLRIIHRASTLSTIHRSLAEIKDSKRKDFDMLADVLCDPGSLFRGGLEKLCLLEHLSIQNSLDLGMDILLFIYFNVHSIGSLFFENFFYLLFFLYLKFVRAESILEINNNK